jgi:hypothetical protein
MSALPPIRASRLVRRSSTRLHLSALHSIDMDKRNRSPSPVGARKRCSPTSFKSNPTSSLTTISNDNVDRERPLASTSKTSTHSSGSSFTGSESTSSQQVCPANKPPSPGLLRTPSSINISAAKGTSINTPTVSSIHAGLATPDSLTPRTVLYEPSHEGTVVHIPSTLFHKHSLRIHISLHTLRITSSIRRLHR